MNYRFLVRGLGIAALVLLLAPMWLSARVHSGEAVATVETDPVPSGGDAADDPAIWVHPYDPSLSLIIGTDKRAGLAVYDLSGDELQYISGIRPNNVDLRYGFPLGGRQVDLVVVSERRKDAIAAFWIDPESRRLVEAGLPFSAGMDVYGICMYRSPISGSFYVFATSEDSGPVRQWELFDDGTGRVAGRQVREFTMETQTEGCVADDELGVLYVGEEDVAIWKYSAEPDGGDSRNLVDRVGARLEDDIEGLTIYYGPGDSGYLIASSQGSDTFVVYQRGGSNEYVTSFQIMAGNGVDEVTGTDGIDVTSVPLGPSFPSGVFVVQDDENDSGNQNFKLVPWEAVAGSASPPLMVQGRSDPRDPSAPLPPAPPIPTPATPGPSILSSTWKLTEAPVLRSSDDGEVVAGAIVADGKVLRMEQGREVVLRFTGLDLPPGAKVRNARVQFTASEEGTGSLVVTIEGLVDAPQGITTVGPRTAAVTWAPAEWTEAGVAGAYQRTPDLSALLRRLLAEPGWSLGDAVTLVFTSTGEGSRTVAAFDEGQAPRLIVEYRLEEEGG